MACQTLSSYCQEIYEQDEFYMPVSAIGNTGDLFFMFHKETMNTDIFKDFILRLEADIKEPVFLIVDHLRVHHAKLLQSWLEVHFPSTPA